MYEIKQVPSNNKSDRGKYAPIAIVNHITAGSLRSVDNWFTSKNNDQASAHFCIGRKGEIHQYVPIEKRAWHAGLAKGASKFATADIVKRFPSLNPNAYTIGIEHEGYQGNGLDGDLTEEQFWASVWLHKYIKEYVKEKYGNHIELNSEYVVGHFQIDPRRKPNCPGAKFPWKRLYEELAIINKMSMKDVENRIKYRVNGENMVEVANALLFRINDLRNKVQGRGQWREAAAQKLKQISELLDQNKLL